MSLQDLARGWFQEALTALEAEGLLRTRFRVDSAPGPRIRHHRRELIHLGSNNYLGLSTHPEVVAAATQALQTFGAGTGASRLITGHTAYHERLEEALAWFFQQEEALVFNTGYAVHTGLIPALVGPEDQVFCDRLCHASILDGIRLSGARFHRYRHRDVEHLETLLCRHGPRGRRRLILTEGVFSMDGDVAPLPDLLDVARRHEAFLLVDDAHGIGVLGPTGRGTVEHWGLSEPPSLLMGTLGKALGTFGAFVVGPAPLQAFGWNQARTLLYSTALPAPVAAAAYAALRVVLQDPSLRGRLWANRAYFYQGLLDRGLPVLESESPILPVWVGEAERALQFAQILQEQGVFAPAIRPPTVPRGTSRIRVSILATHTQEDLDQALAAFEAAGRALDLLGKTPVLDPP